MPEEQSAVRNFSFRVNNIPCEIRRNCNADGLVNDEESKTIQDLRIFLSQKERKGKKGDLLSRLLSHPEVIGFGGSTQDSLVVQIRLSQNTPFPSAMRKCMDVIAGATSEIRIIDSKV